MKKRKEEREEKSDEDEVIRRSDVDFDSKTGKHILCEISLRSFLREKEKSIKSKVVHLNLKKL